MNMLYQIPNKKAYCKLWWPKLRRFYFSDSLSLSLFFPFFFNPNDRKAQIPTNPIPQNVLKFNLKHIFAWVQRQSSTGNTISIRLIRTYSAYTPI